jgi:hypothetical protein
VLDIPGPIIATDWNPGTQRVPGVVKPLAFAAQTRHPTLSDAMTY